MVEKLELKAAVAGMDDINVVSLHMVLWDGDKPKEMDVRMTRAMAATVIGQLAKALQ